MDAPYEDTAEQVEQRYWEGAYWELEMLEKQYACYVKLSSESCAVLFVPDLRKILYETEIALQRKWTEIHIASDVYKDGVIDIKIKYN